MVSATLVMVRAVASSSVAAEVTISSEPATLCWKLRTRASTRSARRWRVDCSSNCWDSSSQRAIAFCRNTSTAFAISPISSVASREGTSRLVSPAANRFIAAVMPPTGRMMLRAITTASPAPKARAKAIRASWIVRVRSVIALVVAAIAPTTWSSLPRTASVAWAIATTRGRMPVS